MALPLLDRHSTVIAAPPAVVLEVAARYARGLAYPDHPLLHLLLGTEPPAGFGIDEPAEGEVSLSGRHRFSDYRLVFAVDAVDGVDGTDGANGANGANEGGTTLTVLSYAAFPGLRGRIYRGLLLGTGGHVLAVRRMLADIGSRAARGSAPSAAGRERGRG
ncbi:hypothetical protein [Nocardioides pantholopis]|uniref:hypothetical protein n=1 Tax=Nocardioides pantholopis TaxID=2483798 RepID=UPI000FD6F718|nr:hypothetical protein [Nocardioides pantholopis]